MTTCKRCGTSGLSWRESVKGKWYLCEPVAVSTSYNGNYIIPKAHECYLPLYDSKGHRIGLISSRDFDKVATIEAISKRIAKLEAQELLGATDDDDALELATLRADLERFTA